VSRILWSDENCSYSIDILHVDCGVRPTHELKMQTLSQSQINLPKFQNDLFYMDTCIDQDKSRVSMHEIAQLNLNMSWSLTL
jgi:hypothetical protein